MTGPERDPERLPPELREGSIFDGKYRVECVLGMGGMGVVLLVHDLALQRDVAIKMLLPEHLTDEEFVARFLREARAAALIHGEHVCRVLEVSQSQSGLPYMVLEWLVGRNLDEVCREEGPLEPGRAVDYVLQACEAVAQAHARGIVHRDIKPANLFLTHREDGAALVKVLDFGISKMSEWPTKEGKPLTKTGVMLGTPNYMAPEQMRSSREVDSRADIWSFGAVLFKLMVGHAPFLAASVGELFSSVLHDPPPLASALRPDVPSGLDQAIRRCLQKEPANRFQTLEDFALAITPFASSADDGAMSAGRIKAFSVRASGSNDGEIVEPTTVDPPMSGPFLDAAETSAPRILAPHIAADSRPRFAVVAAMIMLVVVGAILVAGWTYLSIAPPAAFAAEPSARSATSATSAPASSTNGAANVPEPTSSAAASSAPERALPQAPPSSTAAKPLSPSRPPTQPRKNPTTTSDRHG